MIFNRLFTLLHLIEPFVSRHEAEGAAIVKVKGFTATADDNY